MTADLCHMQIVGAKPLPRPCRVCCYFRRRHKVVHVQQFTWRSSETHADLPQTLGALAHAARCIATAWASDGIT